MTSLQKPKAWNLSPQATQAPELWRHAKSVQPFWNNGRVTDIVQNKDYPITTSMSFIFSEVGRALRIKEGAVNTTGINIPMISGKVYTYLVYFVGFNAGSNNNEFKAEFTGHVDSGNNDGLKLSINQGGKLFMLTLGGNTNGSTSIVVDDGKPHAAAVVFDMADGRAVQIIDGVLDLDASYTDTSSRSDAIFGISPQGSGSGNLSAVDVITQTMIETDSQLSHDVLKNWTLDPFAMLRPAGF